MKKEYYFAYYLITKIRLIIFSQDNLSRKFRGDNLIFRGTIHILITRIIYDKKKSRNIIG